MDKIDINIRKSRFLDWYFDSGSDQEQWYNLIQLGNRVEEQMRENGLDAVITVRSLWDETNVDLIPACFFDGYSECNYDEIWRYYDSVNNINLVDDDYEKR